MVVLCLGTVCFHDWMISKSVNISICRWALVLEIHGGRESIIPFAVLYQYQSLKDGEDIEVKHHWLVGTRQEALTVNALCDEFFELWKNFYKCIKLVLFFECCHKWTENLEAKLIKSKHIK